MRRSSSAAVKNTMASLASSDGCSVNPGTEIQRRVPLIFGNPNTATSSTSAMPTAVQMTTGFL
jgi:hypothetical protein